MGQKSVNLILFIEGIISVALQVFVMRQLIPFIGSSVVAMSMVISVFLSALALGYYVGGKKKEGLSLELSNNFLLSAFLIGVFISYPFIDLFFNAFDINEIVNGFVYLFVFLFPVVFKLGQTVPIMTNYVKQDGVSEIAGYSFAINTVGSVVGGLLTSLVFLYFFGVASTIMIFVVTLCCLSISIHFDNKRFLFVLVIVGLSYFFNSYYENIRFIKTNNYSNYEVIKKDTFYSEKNKILVMNNSWASKNYADREGFEYVEYIKYFLFDVLEKKGEDILVIGSGGFTMTFGEEGAYGNSFTYVDIDKDLIDVAEEHFLDKKVANTFIAKDGRIFIKNSDKKYGITMVDVYTHKGSIPWHFTTIEFMKEVKSVTEENGWVVFNVIGSKNFGDKKTLSIHNTISAVFNNCFVSPFLEKDLNYNTNIVYLCKNTNFKKVYSDNYEGHSIDEMMRN